MARINGWAVPHAISLSTTSFSCGICIILYSFDLVFGLSFYNVSRRGFTALSRSSLTNLITGQRELCEILLEARSKIGSLAIISFFVRPGIPRNEHFAGDTRTSGGR